MDFCSYYLPLAQHKEPEHSNLYTDIYWTNSKWMNKYINDNAWSVEASGWKGAQAPN